MRDIDCTNDTPAQAPAAEAFDQFNASGCFIFTGTTLELTDVVGTVGSIYLSDEGLLERSNARVQFAESDSELLKELLCCTTVGFGI